MATMSGSLSRRLSTQDVKQAEKVSAGSAFITSVSVSCEGIPRLKGSRRRRKVSLHVPQSSISTKFCAPARVEVAPFRWTVFRLAD